MLERLDKHILSLLLGTILHTPASSCIYSAENIEETRGRGYILGPWKGARSCHTVIFGGVSEGGAQKHYLELPSENHNQPFLTRRVCSVSVYMKTTNGSS